MALIKMFYVLLYKIDSYVSKIIILSFKVAEMTAQKNNKAINEIFYLIPIKKFVLFRKF